MLFYDKEPTLKNTFVYMGKIALVCIILSPALIWMHDNSKVVTYGALSAGAYLIDFIFSWKFLAIIGLGRFWMAFFGAASDLKAIRGMIESKRSSY